MDAHPVLYQYVTNQAFQAVIEQAFQTSNSKEAAVKPLTYEEGNALWYVAGYVCSNFQKKIMASTHPMRDRLLLCLMDLCDEDEEVSTSAEWVHTVDRGGLCVYVKARLCSERMELIVRSMFNTDMVCTMTDGIKKELHKTIVADEDVAFHWSMLTVEVEDAEGTVLLAMIVDLFITIRGFSFSKSLMEMYKQETRRCTQKAKSLRRKLAT